MPLQLPTPLQVETETRLRPEQVNVRFSLDDFGADVQGRLDDETAWVAKRLGRLVPPDSDSAGQRLQAQCVLFRVAASLYHAAGQLNEKYKTEALDYERRADDALQALLQSTDGDPIGESGVLTNGKQPAVSYNTTTERRDGYSDRFGEYGHPPSYWDERRPFTR